jgi:hypothetical protein
MIEDTAEQLHQYIRFRAGKEGVEYGLDSDFFAQALRVGAGSIFGVVVRDGQLIEDDQQPEFVPGVAAAATD